MMGKPGEQVINAGFINLLIHLHVARPYDLAPFLGFLGDERSKLFRGAGQDDPAQVGQSRFQPLIGKSRVDLSVELVNDLPGRVAGGADPRQKLASKPGTKSLTVGTSGSSGARVAVVTARGAACPP
jgi:hypothetical protein